MLGTWTKEPPATPREIREGFAEKVKFEMCLKEQVNLPKVGGGLRG
jgi:hypothetical protein